MVASLVGWFTIVVIRASFDLRMSFFSSMAFSLHLHQDKKEISDTLSRRFGSMKVDVELPMALSIQWIVLGILLWSCFKVTKVYSFGSPVISLTKCRGCTSLSVTGSPLSKSFHLRPSNSDREVVDGKILLFLSSPHDNSSLQPGKSKSSIPR